MKTSRCGRMAWPTASLAFVVATFSSPSAAGAQPKPLAPGEPKTHVLFVGADMAIDRDGKLHRVKDVTGTALVIHENGKPVSVQQSPKVAIRVNESLKTTNQRVSLGKLLVERAYTPENDPFQQFAKNAGAEAGRAAMEGLNHMQVAIAENNLTAAMTMDSPNAAEFQQRAQSQLHQAQQTLSGTVADASSDLYDTGAHANRYAAKAAEENFDAIRVSFSVTPEKSLARPYFMVIAQFRERDSKPNTARKWVYTKSLGALEAGDSRNVDFLQGGFPLGFVLENYSVHIFNAGEEFATNFSRKRVDLTEDEAFQYEIIEYIAANKGASVRAQPAVRQVSSDLRQRLEPGQLSETYFVRVSKEGRVVGAFRDAAGKRPLQDPELESVLRAIRFKPALQTGKPIEAIAPLKLGSLSTL